MKMIMVESNLLTKPMEFDMIETNISGEK